MQRDEGKKEGGTAGTLSVPAATTAFTVTIRAAGMVTDTIRTAATTAFTITIRTAVSARRMDRLEW